MGMQIATIEFARYQLGLKDANSYEFDPEAKHHVIHFMAHQSDDLAKGGTMRLGAYPCLIKADTLMMDCYKQEQISERHRHRYEFNNDYRSMFEAAGMVLSGTSLDQQLVEAIEIPANDFYIGVQFHPEFKSRPNHAHPLFKGFIKHALKHQQK